MLPSMCEGQSSIPSPIKANRNCEVYIACLGLWSAETQKIHIPTLASGNSHCVGSEQSEVNRPSICLYLQSSIFYLYLSVKGANAESQRRCGIVSRI